METATIEKLTLDDVTAEFTFDNEFYGVEGRNFADLQGLATDFLSAYNVTIEDLKQYKEEGNDFWNDKTIGGSYWCDLSSEWADWMVDIYNADLREKAKDYRDFIDQAIDEFGNSERGIEGNFMAWQYLYYSNFANEVLSQLKEYVENTEL